MENEQLEEAHTSKQPVVIRSTVTQNKSIDRLAAAIVFTVLLVALVAEQIAHTRYGTLNFTNLGDVLYTAALIMSFLRAIFG